MRWPHRTYGFVPPGQFVPVTERVGLIDPLTELVFTRASEDLCRWHDLGIATKLSVNFSAAYFVDLRLPERLEEHVMGMGLLPSDICIEVTVTAVMQDLADSKEILTRLRLKGIALSNDDLGSG